MNECSKDRVPSSKDRVPSSKEGGGFGDVDNLQDQNE